MKEKSEYILTFKEVIIMQCISNAADGPEC